MQTIKCELKYCERCGSLGLRRAQSGQSYCEPCGEVLTKLWFPGKALKSTRLPRTATTQKDVPLIMKAAAQEQFSLGGAR